MLACVRQLFGATRPLTAIWRTLWRTKNVIKPFCTKKAALADRSHASVGLTLLKNGAKETRTPDPLHAMQLVRSSEFACGNRKKPSIKGISEKLTFKPLWLARASYGGFALKIALIF